MTATSSVDRHRSPCKIHFAIGCDFFVCANLLRIACIIKSKSRTWLSHEVFWLPAPSQNLFYGRTLHSEHQQDFIAQNISIYSRHVSAPPHQSISLRVEYLAARVVTAIASPAKSGSWASTQPLRPPNAGIQKHWLQRQGSRRYLDKATALWTVRQRGYWDPHFHNPGPAAAYQAENSDSLCAFDAPNPSQII